MHKFKQTIRHLEKKPAKELAKMSLVLFFVCFLVGFTSGLFSRELRLSALMAQQRAQRTAEINGMNNLLLKLSQTQSPSKK